MFLSGLAFGQKVPKDWKRFTSAVGAYVLYYPPAWHTFVDLPTLDIYNFPFRRSVVARLPDGGAGIAVVPPPPYIKTLEEWIKDDNILNRQTSRKTISLPSGSKEPVAEVTYSVDDGMESVSCYFELSGHPLVARLLYWKGDSKANEYRHLLHTIIESAQPLSSQ